MRSGDAAKKGRLPVLEGIVPVERARIPADALAGLTLAALAIPEVMGYSRIAGMPLVTGLYTLLLPLLVFALLGSSRHLVVGADSATAAVMAAGLAGLAATGSSQYVGLAGALALVVAVLLVLARLARLAFLADFLSRTVLIGFLTGVGIQVALGQLPEMVGVEGVSGGTLRKVAETFAKLDEASMATVAVTAASIAVILGLKLVTKKVPGALIAVVGFIAVSYFADLADHGVSTVGPVPSGLPSVGLPDVSWGDVGGLIPTAISIAVLVLAQSAATSRAYASKYDDAFREDVDIVGLAAANAAAGLSGTYIVNGSPTKTQMVDGAGGRSQVAHLCAGAITLAVLLFLTRPLQYLPNAVLAAVVFLIGIELVDLAGMRKVAKVRPDEFVVAALTAATVVVVGVEQAIILAIVLSVVDHLRRSYRPSNAVAVPGEQGAWRLAAATPDARSAPGLVVFRFNASLYYANANGFLDDVKAFLASEPPVRWFCLDAAAVTDVDYTAAQVLAQAATRCRDGGVRFVVAELLPAVEQELALLGLDDALPAQDRYPSVAAVLEDFQRQPPA